MLIDVAFYIGKSVYVLRIILITIAKSYLFAEKLIAKLLAAVRSVNLKSVLSGVGLWSGHIAENALCAALVCCSAVNIKYIIYTKIYL